MKLLQKGNSPNVLSETWLLETENEISKIPGSAPAGSIALILTDNGLNIKMKNSLGEWKEL